MLAALGEHVPRLRLVIDDLWKQSDDQLYARAATSFARLVLWALKNGREAGWLGGEVGRWKELIAAVLSEREVPELDVWTERVMTASRLEDVLGPTPA